MNRQLLSKACLALTCTFFVAACSDQKQPSSQGGDNPESSAIAAASKALVSNGFEGFNPTGEIHPEVDSDSKSKYEIIFTNGSSTIEVDVLSEGNTPIEIEEDIQLKDIPNEVQNVASNLESLPAVITKSCKLNENNEVWYEFEECYGKIDIEVKEEGLKVVIDKEDKPKEKHLETQKMLIENHGQS